MAPLSRVAAAGDLAEWREVPERVRDLIVRLRPFAKAAWAAVPAGPAELAWVHPLTAAVWVRAETELTKRADVDAEGPWSALEYGAGPPAPDDGRWVLFKSAADGLGPTLRGAFDAPQRLLGGPTPLTSALAGGALAAGAGYLGGRLAEQFVPEEVTPRGAIPRRLALLGALGGAAPGLWWGSANYRSKDPTVNGWKGFVSRYPFRPDDLHPRDMEVTAHFKQAVATSDTGLFLRSIPVDAFNRAVWNDVRHPGNPFGTKSPWGDNDQPLGTPAPVAATVSGLVAGAGALSGRARVSPWQVGIAAATAAGKGYLEGIVFGKALGLLAGLTPAAQQTVQRFGLWGGALTGAVNALFGE